MLGRLEQEAVEFKAFWGCLAMRCHKHTNPDPQQEESDPHLTDGVFVSHRSWPVRSPKDFKELSTEITESENKQRAPAGVSGTGGGDCVEASHLVIRPRGVAED